MIGIPKSDAGFQLAGVGRIPEAEHKDFDHERPENVWVSLCLQKMSDTFGASGVAQVCASVKEREEESVRVLQTWKVWF